MLSLPSASSLPSSPPPPLPCTLTLQLLKFPLKFLKVALSALQ